MGQNPPMLDHHGVGQGASSWAGTVRSQAWGPGEAQAASCRVLTLGHMGPHVPPLLSWAHR